jgi:hypothetical protein
MIVSASYRTDIPAFYPDWFLNRLRAGWCRTVNPYGGPATRIDLSPAALDGLVFWTRNLGRFDPALEAVSGLGLPFVVQFTLTGAPRALERSGIDPGRAIDQIRAVAARWGPRAVVWRYDPIAATSLTPPDWHRQNFAALAAALAGTVDEVVVSWLQPYRKTARNLDLAARSHGFTWNDPPEPEKRALLAELAELAAARGMALTLCTQPGLAGIPGTRAARCIDARRLSELAGRPLAARTKGNRPGCECAESRDIGAYESCPHGCCYCYAVANPAAARHRFQAHDPTAEFLIGPR